MATLEILEHCQSRSVTTVNQELFTCAKLSFLEQLTFSMSFCECPDALVGSSDKS